VTARRIASAALAALLTAASLARGEECRPPIAPSIPSGQSASDAEMVAARAAVAAFVSASDTYLVCLARRLDEADPNAPETELAALRQEHEDAALRMRNVAARFNAELRIWEKR
jgi:hypothetical protein